MEIGLTEKERENMQKLAVLRTTALGILSKWKWLFLIVFFALWGGGIYALKWRTERSLMRCRATLRLLYSPREVGKVPALGDKQLLKVLERRSLRRRVGKRLELPPGEQERLTVDLSIRQEMRPSNAFELTAYSRSTAAAVAKVNAYADVLMDEYTAYRMEDLSRYRSIAVARENDLREQLANIVAEEGALIEQSGSPAPIEALATLGMQLAEQRKNLLLLEVDIGDEEAKLARNKAILGDNGERILGSTSRLSKISEKIEVLEKEIFTLRGKGYTDFNPLVMQRLNDMEALKQEYREILGDSAVTEVSADDIIRLEQASAELVSAQTRIESLTEKKAQLEEKIALNEERAAAYLTVTPQLTRLRDRRLELEKILYDTDAQAEELGRLEEIIRSDLRPIERAVGATDTDPLSTDNIVLAGAAAFAGTMGLMACTVLLGLLFGRVRGMDELASQHGVRVLGSLPRRWAMRRKTETGVYGVVALNFIATPASHGTVLVCRLHGAKPQPRFVLELKRMMELSGISPFVLHTGEEHPEYPESELRILEGTTVRGDEGWFPIENRFSLTPVETTALRNDLLTIKQDFGCIFVTMHDGVCSGGNALRQLLDACDSALAVIGANKTRRREWSYIHRLAISAEKPLMAIVSGVSRNRVKRELEETRW